MIHSGAGARTAPRESDPATAAAARLRPGLVREKQARGLEQALVEGARQPAQGRNAPARQARLHPGVLQRAATDLDQHGPVPILDVMRVYATAVRAHGQETLADAAGIGRAVTEEHGGRLAPAPIQHAGQHPLGAIRPQLRFELFEEKPVEVSAVAERLLELSLQAVDLIEHLVLFLPHEAHSWPGRARAFASPSPARLTARTVAVTARPGATITWGAVRRTERPSAIRAPQLARFGSPNPKNDRAASARMAPATITEASAMMGPSAFGSTTSTATASGERPSRREASTKGRSRKDSTWARTTRAGPVQAPAASAATITGCVGPATLTRASARTKGGTVWVASAIRIKTSS